MLGKSGLWGAASLPSSADGVPMECRWSVETAARAAMARAMPRRKDLFKTRGVWVGPIGLAARMM